MTRVFVDNAEISAPEDLSSLDGIIARIEEAHLPHGSVIREIRIDGCPVTVENLQERTAGEFGNIAERDRIEFFTGTVAEIAGESIGEALHYLDRIEAVTPSIAEGFQVSPGPGSFGKLRELYEGLYWLNILLDRLKNSFQIPFEDLRIQGASALEHQQRFISILKQLIDSQQRKDFVLLSDLLQYEIVPLVPVWRDMFLMIKAKVNRAQ